MLMQHSGRKLLLCAIEWAKAAGVRFDVSPAGKLTITPASKVPPELKDSLREIAPDIVRVIERHRAGLPMLEPMLADVPPEATGQPYRAWCASRPLETDNRPTWARAKAERQAPAFGFYPPAARCPECGGRYFALMTWGTWVCPKCDPRYKTSHQVKTHELPAASETAA